MVNHYNKRRLNADTDTHYMHVIHLIRKWLIMLIHVFFLQQIYRQIDKPPLTIVPS